MGNFDDVFGEMVELNIFENVVFVDEAVEDQQKAVYFIVIDKRTFKCYTFEVIGEYFTH